MRRRNSSSGASSRTVIAPACCSAARFSGRVKAPPPSATIQLPWPLSLAERSSRKAWVSMSRNPLSPASAKMQATDLPWRHSMTSSRSWNGHPKRCASARPTLVFPAPINPMRMTPRVESARDINQLLALDYCFFTRILPLKDWSSTEDEPELEVPAKELPALGTNETWLFSWRGKSLTTEPLTERAERSTEAVGGRVTSMAPLWVVRRYSPPPEQSPL